MTAGKELGVEMQIKVLGPGCSKCQTTVGIIERAAQAG